jgi:hypothetical protein
MGATYSPQIVIDRTCDAQAVGSETAGHQAPRAPVPSPPRVRSEVIQQLRLEVHNAFALVEEFRVLRVQGAGHARLALLLWGALRAAQSTFALASKARPLDAQASAERARCLSDLEQLLHDLLSNACPAPGAIAHGMDALIVHLVQLMQAPPRAGVNPGLAETCQANGTQPASATRRFTRSEQ